MLSSWPLWLATTMLAVSETTPPVESRTFRDTPPMRTRRESWPAGVSVGGGVVVGVGVGEAVGVGVGVGVRATVTVGLGVGEPTETGTELENSDVLPDWSVAVVVTVDALNDSSTVSTLISALPLMSVVTDLDPINVAP